MATEYYVDPAIDANSGAGTLADPFGDLQHALDTVTRDSTSGDRFNIKEGTDEVLSAALDLSTYGTPVAGAPLFFEGYTSSAGDGGIGGISGGGSASVFSSTSIDAIHFRNLHLHNCGGNMIVHGDAGISVVGCELDGTTAEAIRIDFNALVFHCHIHDAATGIRMTSGTIGFCYFKNDGTTDFTNAVHKQGSAGDECTILHCIFSLDGSSNALGPGSGERLSVAHCSFFTTGTGKAMVNGSATGGLHLGISNNLFEGWAAGIDLAGATDGLTYVSGNAFFDCTDDILDAGDVVLGPDNESLGSTPFAKDGSDTYANRATYFAPVDTGNVLSPFGGMGGAKGAVQPSAGGGGGASATVVARRSFQHFHL